MLSNITNTSVTKITSGDAKQVLQYQFLVNKFSLIIQNLGSSSDVQVKFTVHNKVLYLRHSKENNYLGCVPKELVVLLTI